MSMSIFVYAELGGAINTQALLYLKHYLQNIMSSRGVAPGYVVEDDFKSRNLKSSLESQLPKEAILPHLNLVIESCLHPVLNEGFCIRLQPSEFLVGKDTDYIIALLGYLRANAPASSKSNVFDDFRKDAYRSMAFLADSHQPKLQQTASHKSDPQSQFSEVDRSDYRKALEHGKLNALARPHNTVIALQPSSQPFYSQTKPQARYQFPQNDTQEKTQTVDDYNEMRRAPLRRETHDHEDFKNFRSLNSRFYTDLTTFSSHMRKNGMDIILFPSIHDKVLCCIYLASSITIPGEGLLGHYPPRTHKDLVDVVMHVQQARYLGHDDKTLLSKTKLRGVLGLLKNAGLLIVQHEELEGQVPVSKAQESSVGSLGFSGPGPSTAADGAPIKEVKLIMNAAIRNFEDFRDMHDAYIPDCMQLLRAQLNPVDLTKIVWHIEDKQSKLTKASFYIGLIRGVVKSKLVQTHRLDSPVPACPSFMRTRSVSQDEWEDLSKQIEGMSQIPSPHKDLARQHTPQTMQMFYPNMPVQAPEVNNAAGLASQGSMASMPPYYARMNSPFTQYTAEETKTSPERSTKAHPDAREGDYIQRSLWCGFNQDDDIERLTKDLMKKDF